MISKFKYWRDMVCVGVGTFLVHQQYVYWEQPLDYYLPEGVDPAVYLDYEGKLVVMCIGAFVLYTLINVLKATFGNVAIKVKERLSFAANKSVRRRKGEQL
tara:strand:+ start:285 stop:587 length:303 start_codon:yes stop_codon:yes gene_type:complete